MAHRLLMVDDNEADLLYTQIVLQRSGGDWDVVPVESAAEALRLLTQDAAGFDLILLDINMPAMNGFEFLDAYQRLRQELQARAVVVMLTSSPDPHDRERALAYPCVKGYVTKPIDAGSAQGLRRVLDAAGPARPAGPAG